jgi:excisionase family DNA binding protein
MRKAGAVTIELHMDDDALDRLAGLVAERIGVTARADPEPWVGVKEAAVHLACKPQRVYDLMHDRATPHRKEGARLLFRLSALDEWLDGRG